ncbi:GPI mannosyltransferase 2 [Paraphysoderma sedebokerense]|nr:GPI mannosyltransferase 2 [Paraphysoderma sedebokerense]
MAVSAHKNGLPSILSLFVLSRFSIFILIQFITNYLSIPAFDSSANTLLSLSNGSENFTVSNVEQQLSKVISPFVRWDSVYFLKIAERGYLYEQEFAFWPLLPFLMNRLAYVLELVVPYNLSLRLRAAVAGVLISNGCVLLSSLLLFRLTQRIFKSDHFSYITTLFFIFNPASMVMSSIYTESLFTLLTFAGMYCLSMNQPFMSTIPFTLATCTRSNGILNSGFLIYEFLTATVPRRSLSVRSLRYLAYSIIPCLPFFAFHYYAYTQFCGQDPAATQISNQPRPWCQEMVPSIYSFVQKEYWNVGFLKYWNSQQFGNFVLAAPMWAISFFAIRKWFQTVGGFKRVLEQLVTGNLQISYPKSAEGVSSASACAPSKLASQYAHPGILPYITLYSFMLFYVTFFMHVQVIIRFMTSMPALYWYCSSVIVDSDSDVQPQSEKGDNTGAKGVIIGKAQTPEWKLEAKLLVLYFIVYGYCGVVLFGLFYPPA